MSRLQGWKSVLHDAVDGVTHLVGEGHQATARRVVAVLSGIPEIGPAVHAVDGWREALTEGGLAAVRETNRAVERWTDPLLGAWPAGAPAGQLLPLRSEALVSPAGAADQLQGLLNGAVGDYLRERSSPLDLGFGLRAGFGDGEVLVEGGCWRAGEGERLAGRPRAALGPDLVVLVHGLGTTELSWFLDAERALGQGEAYLGAWAEARLGLAPVLARYNTGLSVRANAAALDDALDVLVRSWPAPVRRVVLIGHSLGGLVVRWALAEGRGAWRARVQEAVTLGSPHEGAPLARLAGWAERLGLAVDLPATRVLGQLVRQRSASLRDLEQASPAPLAEDVRWVLVAGTVPFDPDTRVAEWVGDVLVTVRSAHGGGEAGPERLRLGGVSHAFLQTDPRVLEAVLGALGGAGGAASGV
jgi:pimeloyl-ACP methyl ester carboxylesterase